MTRNELREHLVRHRIAGDVDTPRDNNLRAMRRLADGDVRSWFGLAPAKPYTFEEILAIMVERVGVHPDPAYAEGPDTIDPDITLDRLDAMARRLARAARDREKVLLATGHPAGVCAIHIAVARALYEAGCPLLTPEAGARFEYAGKRRQLRYLAGVGVVSDRGELNHTHSPVPMQHLLQTGLDADLVVADHGWAGAAAEAGYDVVCFADCNDPALPVGEHEGRIEVCVPVDDNVEPSAYQPLADLLVTAISFQ